MQPRDTKEPMFLEKWRVPDTKEVSTNLKLSDKLWVLVSEAVLQMNIVP